MSQVGRIKEFINRNLVTIVMIPSLIMIHYSWRKLQDVDSLIGKDEKKELPIIEGARFLEEKIEAKIESWRGKKEE